MNDVRITVPIPVELSEALEAYAQESGLSKGIVARLAIMDGLDIAWPKIKHLLDGHEKYPKVRESDPPPTEF